MRTDDEIKQKLRALEGQDFFGFIRGDLIGYLAFSEAKEFLKPEATGDDWTVRPRDKASIVAEIKDYMPFAWEKANNCRGISAMRSLNHMQAWLWMIGEDAAADHIDEYDLYGKPQLRAICQRLDLDWRQWDDNHWRNDEYETGLPADSISEVALPWSKAA